MWPLCPSMPRTDLHVQDVHTMMIMQASCSIATARLRRRVCSQCLSSPMVCTTYEQVWFETPETLRFKYQLVKKHGLRGVAMWNLGSLDHTSSDPRVSGVHITGISQLPQRTSAQVLQYMVTSMRMCTQGWQACRL